MVIVNVLGIVLFYALQIFIFTMWGRLILDFIRAFVPQWRPPGIVMAIGGVIFAITDPPIKLVRKVVKPIRVGNFALDFAWAIVILAASFLLSLTRYLILL